MEVCTLFVHRMGQRRHHIANGQSARRGKHVLVLRHVTCGRATDSSKQLGYRLGRPKKPAATPRALAPRATNPAYLLAIIWSRIPSPEGLSFESLLCVEISFGIARIILCGASRPNRPAEQNKRHAPLGGNSVKK